MTHAYDFGRLIKRGFYLSPDMVAAGNFGTISVKKKKKKKPSPFDDTRDELDKAEQEWNKHRREADRLEKDMPKQQPESLSAKSAAYLFGAMLKRANDPTWGQFGYEFAQNLNPWNGRPKGTGMLSTMDRWYNPWTTQQVTEKGEHGLMRAGQAAMGVGAAAGLAAGGLAAAPALGLGGAGTGGTTAATAGTGAMAATQTPAGQNLLQRGSQMAGNVVNGVQRAADVYQRNVAPTLERLNYKPEDILHDGAAAVTGNFDQIKGPNWSKGMLPSGLPQGAPSIPRPLAAWQTMYGNAPGMLPGSAPASTAMAHAGM